jgi:hypothetical protein
VIIKGQSTSYPRTYVVRVLCADNVRTERSTGRFICYCYYYYYDYCYLIFLFLELNCSGDVCVNLFTPYGCLKNGKKKSYFGFIYIVVLFLKFFIIDILFIY